jgi:hypothetical protein
MIKKPCLNVDRLDPGQSLKDHFQQAVRRKSIHRNVDEYGVRPG